MNAQLFSQLKPGMSDWLPWSRARSRVVAFCITSDDSLGTFTEHCNPADFRAYLQRRERSSRTIYVLEGLAPGLTAVLGEHFKLHPSVFADHHRLVAFHNRTTGEAGGLSLLPTSLHSHEHVSFKYHETLVASPRPMGFRNLCEVTGRHIMATRILGSFSEVIIARRKCTVWSRETDAGGWDCLVICDPPIRRILTDPSGGEFYNVTTSPYNGGYPDFFSHKHQRNPVSGPPLTSLLDDICFYIYNDLQSLDLRHPSCAMTFVEKIVASHYMKTAEFVEATIEKIQWSLSRRNDMLSFTLASAEEQWSDVQAWHRRIWEFKGDLRGIMIQLGIAPEALVFDHLGGRVTSVTDYRFLDLRFSDISQRISTVSASITSLVSITGSRASLKGQELTLENTNRSIGEVHKTKVLTTMGVVFIPFAYTCSLFSMADKYSPGGDLFWIYFAVSIPLMAFAALGYFFLAKCHL